MVVVVAVVVIGAAAAYFVLWAPHPSPCCPVPVKGQLSLLSYNFQVSQASGSFFAVLGVFEGQNGTLPQVFLDTTLLTPSNSGLSTWCGIKSFGSFSGSACTVSFSFGASLPPPTQGSSHVLKAVSYTGAAYSFQVTAGSLYTATTSATNYATSTYIPVCPPSSTCDFALSLSINVTCSGCSFSGEYVGPNPGSSPTHVSGTGTHSYGVSSFDSPLSLTWNIAKVSSGGTLEVRVSNQAGGQVLYDQTTSASSGTIAGGWVIVIASGS